MPAAAASPARVAKLAPPPAPVLSSFETTIRGLVMQDGRDLSVRQLAVLLFVGRRPPVDCTVRAISASLGVSKPAITRSFDRLEEQKLMQRRVDRMDRRSVQAIITLLGRALVQRVTA